MSEYLDPTVTRISDSLMLSDLMGCDSVFRYGYENRMQGSDTEKLLQANTLGRLLDSLQERLGPFSVSYGFISDSLSRRIVTYQDPTKPSYHRWELGAAADVCFHACLNKHSNMSPIQVAHIIDQEDFGYSRMITYSESEWICIATNCKECSTGEYRKAFYENRYEGTRVPKHVKYPNNRASRQRVIESHGLDHDWRGRGWPQYHGSGKFQFHHDRVSEYTTVSDFLYARDMVHNGIPNRPPLTNKALMESWRKCATMAGEVIDILCTNYMSRFSITRAYNSTVDAMKWDRRFTLELVPPIGLHPNDVAHLVQGMPIVKNVSVDRGRVRILGVDI